MKKLGTKSDIDFLFKKGSLVHGVNPVGVTLLDRIKKISKQKKEVKLFYGETVDEFGLPIDPLKYYFYLACLSGELARSGIKNSAVVVIADVASLINKSSIAKEDLIKKSLVEREKTIKKIIKTYKLPLEVRLMSHIFTSYEYKNIYKKLTEIKKGQTVFNEIEPFLIKTVLKNKLKQEYMSGFKYAIEAIATSMLFDVKVGPPREKYYDQATNILNEKLNRSELVSIYLNPSYPLGKDFTFFISNPQIEKFGVTPYKAGSNRLMENRIILGKTDFYQVENLIESSFESISQKTAHPVFDIYQISQLAKCILSNETNVLGKKIGEFKNEKELKKETIEQVKNSIYKPLNLT